MNKPFHSRFDYVADDKSQAHEPDDGVRKRFERMMSEAFDSEGRLRREHRPTPRPPPPKKLAPSMFIVAMDGNDGRLPAHIA